MSLKEFVGEKKNGTRKSGKMSGDVSKTRGKKVAVIYI